MSRLKSVLMNILTKCTRGLFGHPTVVPIGTSMFVTIRNHGPGASWIGAEPCFGEIIIGRDTIDHVRSLPGGEGTLLENPVNCHGKDFG